MKQLLLLLINLLPGLLFSQMLLKPGNPCIEYKRIADEKSTMIWYLMQDTTKLEIGSVSSDIKIDSQLLIVVTVVKVRQSPVPWIDSTVAERHSLKPLYHSSHTHERDMTILYNDIISGYYTGKQKQATIAISDSTGSEYFDSNLYPMLIRWLPLRTGFTRDLAIYDFNANGQAGVIKASVIAVRQCEYRYQDKELRKVYMVTVRDDISNGTTTYYIDMETRKLWKMVIASGERKMIMEAA